MEILIISGLSGGGKSRAASFLEDMGFYIVDNIFAGMILKFAEFCSAGSGRYNRVAWCTMCAPPTPSMNFWRSCPPCASGNITVPFCSWRRMWIPSSSATRRPAGCTPPGPVRFLGSCGQPRDRPDGPGPGPGGRRGRFQPLLHHPSARELLRLFGGSRDAGKMQVSVVSFGFKHGLPLEADLVFDVRFMPNPFYIDALRPKTGLDQGCGIMYFPSGRRSSFWRSSGSFWASSCRCTRRKGRRCW